MTRRALLAAMAGAAAFGESPLVIPVRRLWDARAKLTDAQKSRFVGAIWPEAVRDFGRAGLVLSAQEAPGEVGRAASGRPVFKGLEHGRINLVITDYVPLQWDQARGLAGLTTQYDGYHLCIVALQHAHGHQAPLFSTNTCVHELLHVLLHDIFETRPPGAAGNGREWRIDWYATRLWLIGDNGEIRRSAEAYLRRG